MRLSKLHGLGNDFLVLLDHGSCGPVAPGRVRDLCERRTGVGADGLIRSERLESGLLSFELSNSDGSAAEMSGNGARCLGLAAARAGWWEDRAQPLGLRTPAGERQLGWQAGDLASASLCVEMGGVLSGAGRSGWAYDLADAPTAHWTGWSVQVGNPHAVALIDGDLPPAEELDALLAKVEPGGPSDINYEFVVRGPGEGSIIMVVRERGAGWTQACGTGSVAAAWAALQQGWVGSEVTVHNPGGAVQVDLSGAEARLAGPVVFVADVEVEGGSR